jgi:hypothetical protein
MEALWKTMETMKIQIGRHTKNPSRLEDARVFRTAARILQNSKNIHFCVDFRTAPRTSGKPRVFKTPGIFRTAGGGCEVNWSNILAHPGSRPQHAVPRTPPSWRHWRFWECSPQSPKPHRRGICQTASSLWCPDTVWLGMARHRLICPGQTPSSRHRLVCHGQTPSSRHRLVCHGQTPSSLSWPDTV